MRKLQRKEYSKVYCNCIKEVVKRGFESYKQVERDVKYIFKKENIQYFENSSARRYMLKMKEQGELSFIPKTKNSNKKLKEVLSTKSAAEMFNLVRLTPRAERELLKMGFTKNKSNTFPYKVTYTR